MRRFLPDEAKASIIKAVRDGMSARDAMRAAIKARDAALDDPEIELIHWTVARTAQSEMKSHFDLAIRLTQDAYHLKPQMPPEPRSAKPLSADGAWSAGLSAPWAPEFSAPAYREIRGTDGRLHYVSVDPKDAPKPDDVSAFTDPDGKVTIMPSLFERIIHNDEPGLLASVLHHEAVHYTDLITTGWDTHSPFPNPEQEKRYEDEFRRQERRELEYHDLVRRVERLRRDRREGLEASRRGYRWAKFNLWTLNACVYIDGTRPGSPEWGRPDLIRAREQALRGYLRGNLIVLPSEEIDAGLARDDRLRSGDVARCQERLIRMIRDLPAPVDADWMMDRIEYERLSPAGRRQPSVGPASRHQRGRQLVRARSVVAINPDSYYTESADQRAYWLSRPHAERVEAGRQLRRSTYRYMTGRNLPTVMERVVRVFRYGP